MNDLKKKGSIAAAWSVGGAAVKIFLQFFIQIILARLVGPQEYGVFSAGVLIVAFSSFFADFGLAYGLVNKKNVTEEDIKLVTTWHFLLGCMVGFCIIFFGDSFFDKYPSDSEYLIYTFALICFLSALMAPSNNLLIRNLDFKTINIAKIASYFIGYVFFGIPMAIYGYGAWALVVSWMVQVFLNLLILYHKTRHAIGFQLWGDDAKEILVFGQSVFITNIINWPSNNFDKIAITNLFDSKTLGLYSGVHSILFTFSSAIVSAIQPILYSSTAKIVNKTELQARIYLLGISFLSIFFLPILIAVSLIPEAFIVAIYGKEWATASLYVSPIALYVFLFAYFSISTSILWSLGKGSLEIKIQIPLTFMMLVIFMVIPLKVITISWFFCSIAVVRCFIITAILIKILDINIKDFLKSVRVGIVISAFVAATCLVSDEFHSKEMASIKLGLSILYSAFVYFSSLYLLRKLINNDMATIFSMYFKKISNKIRA